MVTCHRVHSWSILNGRIDRLFYVESGDSPISPKETDGGISDRSKLFREVPIIHASRSNILDIRANSSWRDFRSSWSISLISIASNRSTRKRIDRKSTRL